MTLIESVREMDKLGQAIVGLGLHADGVEELANQIVETVYEGFRLPDGSPMTALMRFFLTIPVRSLPADLQNSLLAENRDLSMETNCLTLLATRGQLPEWNSRHKSKGHQAIPLTSAEFLEKAPMIHRLSTELGVSTNRMIQPAPMHFVKPSEKTYTYFHVPEAAVSPSITAQKTFVQPFGIHSVVAIGGTLSTGSMFSLIGFFKKSISKKEAANFNRLAGSIETAVINVVTFERRIPKVLVADVPEGATRVARCLGLKHDISVTHSLSDALSKIKSTDFDLIVSGVHFDESRMFELLNAVRNHQSLKSKPFVCIRELESTLFDDNKDGIVMAANHMDACFLDTLNLNDVDLKAAIESYIPKNIWSSELSGETPARVRR